MIASIKDSDELRMNAYCDGELDPISAVEFERRLADDKTLKARYDRLLALRRAVRSLPQYDAPSSLRARIQSALDAGHADRPRDVIRPVQTGRGRRRSSSLQALAAAAVFGAVISSSVLLTIERYDSREEVARQVVAGHIRSLLASQPFDVASSDRHTVKPWFAHKLAGATTVLDLKTDGFPLVGGRVDVVGATPIATLIYQRREHQIALSETPGSGDASSAPRDSTRDGYALHEWSDRGRRYVAISDLPPAELDAFGEAFRRAAEAEREEPAKP